MNIDPKKKFLAISTLGLPVIALLVFVFTSPRSAHAFPSCFYAGQEYSDGADARNGCPAGQVQTCTNGSWNTCHY